MNDVDLLRKFEPVVCYTQGEVFFPCAVDGYVRRCSLWLSDNKGNERQLAAEGELTAEILANYRDIPARHGLYMRFVNNPPKVRDRLPWQSKPRRPTFKAPGRLARVSWYSRMADLLFNVSLVIRGTVPGGTTAGAEILYRDMYQEDPRDVYHGRVIRDGGYTILQYMFFHAMNDWRSGFYGVNDHEGDWEQLLIYLSKEDGVRLVPRWVACASHDFSGDDLRRRWDDPELGKSDEDHVMVFAAAGSHSTYFSAGEYLMNVQPAFLMPVKKVIDSLERFWVETLGQGDVSGLEKQASAILRMPFVDYARGDGVCIGPGQTREWTPVVISEETGWVTGYRGLWGLDTEDFVGGERAPAGPKYNRDGSVRQTWYDPLGWAGLDKVPPPEIAAETLRATIAALRQERDACERTLTDKREVIRSLGLQVDAFQRLAYLSHLYKVHKAELEKEQEQFQATLRHSIELDERIATAQSSLVSIETGDRGDPRGHIRNAHNPEPPAQKQWRLTEYWAASSASLLLLAFVGLTVWEPSRWWIWLLAIAGGYIVIEAILHQRLTRLLPKITLVLAVATTVVLIIEFWWVVIIAVVFYLVSSMLLENLREVRRT